MLVVYRFVINDKFPLQIAQTVLNSYSESIISFNENGENPITKLSNTQTYTMAVDDPDFKIGRMYYIIIKEMSGNINAVHSITLT